MDLKSHVQDYFSSKLQRLSADLASKHGMTRDEAEDVVRDFLKETYGPAERLVQELSQEENPVVLFIGKADCVVCQRSMPALLKFLRKHTELKLISIDYSDPWGLLYHILYDGEKGPLPMIAMIYKGSVKAVVTGECVHQEIYERCYSSLGPDGSQNIYAICGDLRPWRETS